MNNKSIKAVIEVILVALVYILTARVGQTYAISPGNVTPVWLPSGIMFALVLIRGYGVWPGIFIGAMLGNSWAYADFSTATLAIQTLSAAVANGMGDTLCAVGAVWLLKRKVSTETLFINLSSFRYFLLFAVTLGPLLSAVFGVTSLLLTGFIQTDVFLLTFATWWLGDGVGVLLISPAILAFFYQQYEPELKKHAAETALFSFLLLLTSITIFFPHMLQPALPNPVFLMVPLLLWSVFRLGLRMTFTSSLYLASITILATSMGLGPFMTTTTFMSIIALQMYFIIVTCSIFIAGALIYEKEQLLTEIQARATHDGLTGTHNRQYFNEQLEREIHRQQRYDTPLSLIMFDIDEFKRVNDTYGHMTGDDVLVKLTGIIRKELRDIDTLARWGGEEFVIMMPETPSEGACIFAERIRALIEKSNLLPDEHITISVGVVERSRDIDPEPLMQCLDEAMYRSKESGRNRVEYISLPAD